MHRGRSCCWTQDFSAIALPGSSKALPCTLQHTSFRSELLHFSRYLRPDSVASILQLMREMCSDGSHLMLHSMPPPHPDESAGAHVPYEFTAAAHDCAALLLRTGWHPAPVITYASALADVLADPALQKHAAEGLCDALSVTSSSCDALTDAFASYFIPAST
jgi:hypothetical protein